MTTAMNNKPRVLTTSTSATNRVPRDPPILRKNKQPFSSEAAACFSAPRFSSLSLSLSLFIWNRTFNPHPRNRRTKREEEEEGEEESEMCRSVIARTYPDAWDRLKIRAFHLRLFFSGSGVGRPVPEAVTLVYLPRISVSVLEINGSKVKPDASAFLALHRVRSAEPPGAAGRSVEAVYASTDRVHAGDGVRFEVYIGAEKALKGVFRRGGGEGRGWTMECTCAAEGELEASVATAEVCIAGEGGAAMVERVKLSARRSRRRRLFCSRLEEIPEESDGYDCSCCGADEEEDEYGKWEMVRSDGGKLGEESGTDGDDVLEVDLEGVRWAVDLGIWAVCLGVGLLVSKASYKGLRKKILF